MFDLDFGEAARMLVDHLYALGHREIILISPHQHVLRVAVRTCGVSARPHWNVARGTACASSRIRGDGAAAYLLRAERHSRRASHGDCADHPQRRDDRRASSGPERPGNAGAGRHLGRRHLFRRLRTTVLAAVHGNRDIAGQAGSRCGPGARAADERSRQRRRASGSVHCTGADGSRKHPLTGHREPTDLTESRTGSIIQYASPAQ